MLAINLCYIWSVTMMTDSEFHLPLFLEQITQFPSSQGELNLNFYITHFLEYYSALCVKCPEIPFVMIWCYKELID